MIALAGLALLAGCKPGHPQGTASPSASARPSASPSLAAIVVTTVSCPTEDSCTADYHDHAWHIRPERGAEVRITAISCPTEDSCTADYHDHAWHIRQVIS